MRVSSLFGVDYSSNNSLKTDAEDSSSKVLPSKRRGTNSLPKFRLFRLLFLRLVLRYLIEVSSVNCKRIPWLGEGRGTRSNRIFRGNVEATIHTWNGRLYTPMMTQIVPRVICSRGTNSRYKGCFEIASFGHDSAIYLGGRKNKYWNESKGWIVPSWEWICGRIKRKL